MEFISCTGLLGTESYNIVGGREGEASVTLITLVPDRDNVLFMKIEESLTSIFSFWHASKKGNLILYDAWHE